MSRRKNHRLLSSPLCKKERGDLLAFRIVVKEYRIENPFRTVSVHKDTHGSGSSLNLLKRSFNEIGSTNLLPQGLLGFLKLLGLHPPFLLRRKFHLIEREQIVNL